MTEKPPEMSEDRDVPAVAPGGSPAAAGSGDGRGAAESGPPGTRPGEVPGVIRPERWPPPTPEPTRIPARTRRTLGALAEAVAPRDDGYEPDARAHDEVLDCVESLYGSMDGTSRAALRAALALLEWGTVPRHGRRFSRLSTDARNAALDRWVASRIYLRRLVVAQLVGVCQMGYFNQERLARQVGWDPHPMLARLVRERREIHGAPPL